MKIKLTKGYFIEMDELNFTLKQRYKEKNRDGIEKDAIRTVSYHRTIGQAIEKFISMIQSDLTPNKEVTLLEYLNLVTQENKKAVQAIKSLVEGKE